METRRTDHRRFDAPRRGHSVPPQGTYPSIPQSSGFKTIDEAANLTFQVLVLMIYQTRNPLQSSKRSTFSAGGDESGGTNKAEMRLSTTTSHHQKLMDMWQTPRHVAKLRPKVPIEARRCSPRGFMVRATNGEKYQNTM